MMRTCARLGVLLVVVGAILVGSAETVAAPGTTRRVSVDSAGGQADGLSEYPAISSDGRYVAFHSFATNLVPGDTNQKKDVFVHDRQTWVIQRVSVSSAGAQGVSDSASPAINSDGRYVAFQSFADNLVSGDTALCGPPPGYSCPDIFVRDRQTSATERVSLSSAEVQANEESWSPAINDDGRYVAFYSFATNLVSGDTNNVEDIFVRDRQTGTTVRASLASDGTQANGASNGWLAISSTGRFVAFTSDASNLVTGDTLGFGDVFVRDRDTDTDGIFDEVGAVSTARVSVDSAGAQSNGESFYAAISSDGRYVAFGSFASNLVTADTNSASDVFVRDRQTSTTTRVSLDSAGGQGNAGSFDPAISADGDYVGFYSGATNLVDSDTNAVGDIFVRDRSTGTTTRISGDTAGGQGNGESLDAAISGDGHQVAFNSFASNLVPGDTNTFCDTDGDTQADDNCPDVFVHDALGTVGGIAELPEVARDSGRPEIDRTLLAGLAAAALALLTLGAWYAGRRFRQG